MKNKLSLLLCNRSNFKICYFIFLSLNMVQYINVNIISRILLTFFTIWGLLIIISECLAKKGCNYANKNIIFPVAMLIWCFISFIGNWKNNGLYNIFSLYYYGLCILVLYINGSFLEQDRKELICIAKLYTWLSLIISSICIYMFLWQKSISFPGRNGYEMRMGVWENRLFGVFSSPNVGGTFFFIGIILSLYLIYINKDKNKCSFVCYLNIAMALWYIALSLSRGTYLSMFISSFLMVILFQGSHIKCKRRMNEYLKRIFLWISIVIGFFVLVHLIRNVSQSLVNIFSKDEIAFERIEYSNNISDKDVTSVPRTEEPETIDISNKRFAIWNASIKMVMTSPIIGVGNSYTNYHNMSLEEREYFTSHERIMIDYSGGNIHNGYLQILVYCGIVALILYLSFLICSLLKVIIFFRFTKNIYLTNQCIFLFTLVVYLLANNLVETNMALMGANAFQAAFWLFSGYVISLCNITKKKGKL